ncbi:hypothetical protein SLE2022_135220 [Rubroshorea leprosula]
MKLIGKLSPKRFFRSKKEHVSRSDPSSFSHGSNGTSSSSSSDDPSSSNHKRHSAAADIGTPTSVLPGDWSDDAAPDAYYELPQTFKIIGRDNNGVVSRSQLEALFSRLGAEPPSQEEVSMMLSEVDGDGDGCITVDALMNRVVGSVCDPVCEPELRETFDFFDTDHDGKITAEELLAVFTSIGDEQCTLEDCRRMIAGVDKSGDGFVCFEDFSRMMELQR